MQAVIIADFAECTGGAQAVAVLSAQALRRRGIDVTFIRGVSGPVDPRLAESGVELVSLDLEDVWEMPSHRAARSGIWNREAAHRLSAALSRLRAGPKVLHLHQWTRSLSPAIFPVLLRAGSPLVVTLHDYAMTCPNGVYYRFDQGEPCRLTPLSPGCAVAPCDPRSGAHKAIRLLRTVATRAALGRSRFSVVHVSDRGRDTIAPFLPPGLDQHRIDNPVVVEKRAPATVAPGARIAFVGRLTREKGADLVAAAATSAGVQAMFVGEGPSEAAIRRIAPGAEILGWRSREDVDALLRTSILAVAAPSRWFETGPLTVYEAMASGVPPVVSARAGAAEKVSHGETGLVVQPSVESLAAAFRSLAIGETARRMGRAAYESYWKAPLDPDRHARELATLYDRLLAPPEALSAAA